MQYYVKQSEQTYHSQEPKRAIHRIDKITITHFKIKDDMLILEEADLSPRICKGNILRMHTDKNEVTLVEISNGTTLWFYGFTQKAMGDRPSEIIFVIALGTCIHSFVHVYIAVWSRRGSSQDGD